MFQAISGSSLLSGIAEMQKDCTGVWGVSLQLRIQGSKDLGISPSSIESQWGVSQFVGTPCFEGTRESPILKR